CGGQVRHSSLGGIKRVALKGCSCFDGIPIGIIAEQYLMAKRLTRNNAHELVMTVIVEVRGIPLAIPDGDDIAQLVIAQLCLQVGWLAFERSVLVIRVTHHPAQISSSLLAQLLLPFRSRRIICWIIIIVGSCSAGIDRTYKL